jgi:hypothetical protein
MATMLAPVMPAAPPGIATQALLLPPIACELAQRLVPKVLQTRSRTMPTRAGTALEAGEPSLLIPW